MIECPIPQDVLKYKPKMVANFSTRQLIWASVGLGVGLFSFFFLFKDSGEAKIYLTTLMILPELCIGFLNIYGQPFEKAAPAIVEENFLRPAKRLKKVVHPEWERFKKAREWELEALYEEIDKEFEMTEEDIEKAKKNKPGKSKQKKKKIKIESSSQWIAIH